MGGVRGQGLGFLATVIGFFCYSGDISYGNGFFCNGASWGGFFAAVPRVFFASVSTSRQGNFKTTKITAGKLRFFGISLYSYKNTEAGEGLGGRIADDHDGGLCFEPVVVVVVAVAVAGGAGAGVAAAGGAGAGGVGVGVVRGGKLKK